MSDIRKREGKNGTTYQIRFPSPNAKSGYSYKSFRTLKEAKAYREGGALALASFQPQSDIKSVGDAVDLWLRICEKEGTDGQEPITAYTLKTYQRRAVIMKSYVWEKPIYELTTPDIVIFRSWLLQNYSHYQAHKALSSLHTVFKEMALRGVVETNVVSGVSIKSSSRYDEDVVIPTTSDVKKLLLAADELSNSTNKRVAKVWQRYRPILYLAADSGMRPQEYLAIGVQHLKPNGVSVERAIERGGYRLSVTKTKAGRRFIELSNKTLQMLEAYRQNHYRENEEGLLFSTDSGRWLDVGNWRDRGFYVACETAGLGELKVSGGTKKFVSKYTPYALRHFYASMLIHQKENLKKIQRLLGHEKIETTFNIYGHLIARSEDDSVSAGMLDRIVH